MKTTDFSSSISSIRLAENLEKQFGSRVNLNKYNREQLEDMRNRLRTRVFQQEGSAKFNDLLQNESYQKDKAMLELLNTRIKEMLGENIKKLRDKMDELSEAKKGTRPPKTKITAKGTKPDFLDMDKDGDKKEPMKKAVKDKAAKKPVQQEGWDDMMKAVKDKAAEKGTGKFDSKKISTGTVYTKKHTKADAEETPAAKAKKVKEGVKHSKGCDCKECMSTFEGKKAKPDFLDMDKDGNKKEPMKKAVADKKKGAVKESMYKHNVRFVNESLAFLLREDEEGKAKTITAAGDMVNDFTSWMQRVGQYQTKAIIELSDQIRAEFGQAEAEQFKQTVGPALSATLETLTTNREAISSAVATLAGEATPDDAMGMDPMAGGEPPMEPGMDAAMPDAMNPELPGGDEFGASDAAAGGAETAGRGLRESKEVRRARKLAEAHSIMAKLAK